MWYCSSSAFSCDTHYACDTREDNAWSAPQSHERITIAEPLWWAPGSAWWWVTVGENVGDVVVSLTASVNDENENKPQLRERDERQGGRRGLATVGGRL
jgi:hypothetical protein